MMRQAHCETLIILAFAGADVKREEWMGTSSSTHYGFGVAVGTGVGV